MMIPRCRPNGERICASDTRSKNLDNEKVFRLLFVEFHKSSLVHIVTRGLSLLKDLELLEFNIPYIPDFTIDICLEHIAYSPLLDMFLQLHTATHFL